MINTVKQYFGLTSNIEFRIDVTNSVLNVDSKKLNCLLYFYFHLFLYHDLDRIINYRLLLNIVFN